MHTADNFVMAFECNESHALKPGRPAKYLAYTHHHICVRSRRRVPEFAVPIQFGESASRENQPVLPFTKPRSRRIHAGTFRLNSS